MSVFDSNSWDLSDLGRIVRSVGRTTRDVGRATRDVKKTYGDVAGSIPGPASAPPPPQAPVLNTPWGPPPAQALPPQQDLGSVTMPQKPSLPSQPTITTAPVLEGSRPADGNVGETTAGIITAAKADFTGLRLPVLSPELATMVDTVSVAGATLGIALGATGAGALVMGASIAHAGYKAHRAALKKQLHQQPWAMKPRSFNSAVKDQVEVSRITDKTESGRNIHRLTLSDKKTGAPYLVVESEYKITSRAAVTLLHAGIVDAAKAQGQDIPKDVTSDLEYARSRIDIEARIRSGNATHQSFENFGLNTETKGGEIALKRIGHDASRYMANGASIALAGAIKNGDTKDHIQALGQGVARITEQAKTPYKIVSAKKNSGINFE